MCTGCQDKQGRNEDIRAKIKNTEAEKEELAREVSGEGIGAAEKLAAAELGRLPPRPLFGEPLAKMVPRVCPSMPGQPCNSWQLFWPKWSCENNPLRWFLLWAFIVLRDPCETHARLHHFVILSPPKGVKQTLCAIGSNLDEIAPHIPPWAPETLTERLSSAR